MGLLFGRVGLRLSGSVVLWRCGGGGEGGVGYRDIRISEHQTVVTVAAGAAAVAAAIRTSEKRAE